MGIHLAECRTGGKEPVVCQSDDQFTVFNHAVKHGMEVRLQRASYYDTPVHITVPELDVWGTTPFDGRLHAVAELLRSEQT